jgi:O-antigen ligase
VSTLQGSRRAILSRVDLTHPAADGTTFLTVYLVMLFAIPSRLVVGPLGAAGTPALLVGVSGLLWWFWHNLARSQSSLMRTQPVRRSMLVLVFMVLASYVAAMSRPITMTEMSSTEAGVLIMLSWLGILLVANDGVPDRDRLDAFIRRLCLAGGLVAVLGIVQFATGKAFTDLIQIPGLTQNTVLVSVRDRDGFNRPAGTALHPIEFGTALTVLLPLCLHHAFHPGRMSPARRWFPVLAIALAVPLSISRSAIIGAVVVLAIVMPTWSWTARLVAFGGMLVGLVGMFVGIPGFLGTITHLFTGVAQDSSALSRSDSYTLAWQFVERSPIIGRGFLTFLPEYRILDNQYLGMLIDTGFAGMLSLIAVFATAVVVARRVRRRSLDPTTRSLSLSLLAATTAAATSFAFFDAFSFPMLAGLTFLVVGLIGGLHRLCVEASDGVTTPER